MGGTHPEGEGSAVGRDDATRTATDGVRGPSGTRGSHRIFLGYAAGVGKTYAMLVEARLRAGARRGRRRRVPRAAYQADTRKLAERLDRVPPKVIAYRGSEFTELDTDAVIARNPRWVVVDELAHTNVPGARHEKRWKSVEEILDAGIGVLSTLNVQHIESLNDFVYQVTGVRVSETVPDAGPRRGGRSSSSTADPDDLLARVKRGSVLPPDQSRASADAFLPQADSHGA